MKNQIKSLLLVTFMLGTIIPAWGQASTEGKEFWVALNMTTGTGGDDHEPFICITTQHAGGSYTISNPADPNFPTVTGPIPPTGYIKVSAVLNPTVKLDGTSDFIDLSKWYPQGGTAQNMSNKVKPVGLKITTTVDCSVFVGNRLPQSFDAANILPITALQTEYITQDYPGYDHEANKGGGYPVTTILATEDNTQVTFIPSSNVLNGNGTATIKKTLNKGDVLYFTGENRASLSGSIVNADKKIAVFTGVNNTDVPGPVSARDHLYEQNMPVEYWGTHFVVTRSMKKDANRIRVTAKENNTQIFLDGSAVPVTTISSGETYEFELCSAEMRTQSAYTRAVAEGRGTEYYLEGDAHYLETSCPCAVFSYDVSEKYFISSGTSEVDASAAGDPSMVWISPIEQQLRKVTFGVMNTDKTTTHYVNIITPTTGATSLKVMEITEKDGKIEYGNNIVQPTDIIPVSGNSAYSYARIKLTENKVSVYAITSDIGFIAHVYGSGDKESYAYSAGSAAVEYGVMVGDETFIDGYRSDTKFCLGTELEFDARVGTSEITRVDWNFGDGTTQYNGDPVTKHQYNNPGWYDVTADLWGHQVCTDDDNIPLGSVNFTFRVWKHDTVIVEPEKICLDTTIWQNIVATYGQDSLDNLLAAPKKTILNPDTDCYVDRQLSVVTYGLETTRTVTAEDYDSVWVHDRWYYSDKEPKLPADGIITWIEEKANEYFCDIHVTCYAHIITCLKIDIPNKPEQQEVCLGEDISIPYEKFKGDIDQNQFIFTINEIPSYKETLPLSNANISGTINLPLDAIKKPGHYTGKIHIDDLYCTDQPKDETINFTVLYPSDIFQYKFNNVLAVYKPGSGGNTGYEFNAYQWYRNGVAIPGATESVLYLGQGITFNKGDIVLVELTDKGGMTLKSCPQTIEKVDDYDAAKNNAPRKILQDQRIRIIRDGKVYDMYGQKVK